MAVRPIPARLRPILLLVGLVGLGALMVIWLVPLALGAEEPATGDTRKVTAVVLSSAPCAASAAHDVIELREDGQTKKAKLDGCGHRDGEQLEVEVPKEPAVTEETLLRLAGTTATGSGVHAKLGAVLLIMSAAAGALYAFLLRKRLPVAQPATAEPDRAASGTAPDPPAPADQPASHPH